MATHKHKAFWLDLLTKIGAPIFAGTLVACLVKEEARPVHFVLLGVGLGLVYLGHRIEHHAD